MASQAFWRDASGRLTFELFDVPASEFGAVCRAVTSAFELLPAGDLVTNGVSIAFRTYQRGNQVVGLAWDNWTGFTVFAETPASEMLVREISRCLLSGEWGD